MLSVFSSSDDTALTTQQLQSLVEYLPSEEEAHALKQYIEGSDSNDRISDMCECEKFMIATLNVRQAKNKIRCLLFKQQFSTCFDQLEKGGSNKLLLTSAN